MAFRRRGRRRRGLWLPLLGHELADDPQAGTLRESSLQFFINVGPDKEDVRVVETGLTFDFPAQGSVGIATTPSLADFIGSGYALRRICGKLTLQHLTAGNTENTQPAAARVGAAFMVRRVDELGNTQVDANSQNSLLAENIQDPWIWRQTWNLGGTFDATRYPPNFPITQIGPQMVQDLPSNNVFDGSAKNGPFFDIRTKRTVSNEERLFFSVSTKAMPLDTVYEEPSIVYVHLDLRIFAFPLRSMGNRGNASR